MTKKKRFFINEASLDETISGYCKILDKQIKNPRNNQTRYTLVKDEKNFYIDVYFRSDKTITVIPLNKGEGRHFSTELYGIIRDSDEYQNVVSGSFTVSLSAQHFHELNEYLVGLPGVSQTLNEDKGANGIIKKYQTDYGDSVTLTFYSSTSKMFYQGFLMNLYAIIKTFISPLTQDFPKTIMKFGKGKEDKSLLIDDYIRSYLPKGFDLLDPIMQGFVRDTFTLVVANTKLTDYAAWAMAIIRVLEHRIKDICLENNYYIDDEKGFKYFTSPDQTEWLFFQNKGNTVVNNKISSILGADTCNILVKCYDFLKENRHEMFHTTQIVSGTKLVPSPEDAMLIIKGACELIEESLIYNKTSLTN